MTRADRTRTAFGWLAPPAVWFVTLEVNSLLARWVCSTGDRWIYSLVALLALAIISLAAVGVARGASFSDEAGEPAATRRFLALGGLLLSVVSAIGVIALTLPGFVHRPCD
jgi:hypothetical protein